ncbi:5-methyltetrahydropteroyltriglutamate--homocysteine S-methyltransferase [Beggiatoa alba B18LD]|uniref:5-methyltetrahydropteroyltriglutamate--homocysteine methyltransferase n=1 Tax=Beggiatoa alba B18LD TaxID=395493 RepID=I3CDW5_9GAMM|nr:5-methyltetrahydropteroyltriglutamate--homocysteine S-methyltransferase [Beggiatoa alba]EIJ41808.1 5-methyltetrahydropteroyltriglutamate--homocysteine S-methyltransferase [Beggiatoa alba B18LD]
MLQTHVLGFPRIGLQRELKFALEKYWRHEIDADALELVGQRLRTQHWVLQQQAGLDYVTVGDFAFYDHVLNHIQLLGCEPTRFNFTPEQTALNRYFIMARGVAADTTQALTQPALEMTKWFDTNYHYLVPEFTADTQFSLQSEQLFQEVQQAQQQGYAVKVVLISPLSFLWLGKITTGEKLSLLPRLIPVYQQILQRLHTMGVQWVQFDEPILGLDLTSPWKSAFQPTYDALATIPINLLLTSYFSPLADNLNLACQLPVAGLHIDAVRAPEEVQTIAQTLATDKVLSIGIIDGRNIWRTDLNAVLPVLKAIQAQRQASIWLAPSCSLLHCPLSLSQEQRLDAEVRTWLAFATEKLEELHVLKQALSDEKTVESALQENARILHQRRNSTRVHVPAVEERLTSLDASSDKRHARFNERQAKQRARFNLPLFPTTTIGSFPQTSEIRATRAAFKAGKLDQVSYIQQMQSAIAHAIEQQTQLGLDVLVHGEAERNDMVEYFGEQLEGFAFTQNGWVQSYGSRCVKPPIIYGDVWRARPMTVEWTTFAQSLTEKPMKGMLTGPITILQWSFVRDDQSRAQTALQIALAIRDEVVDLEHAGIGIIQIDEPAIREGLPLRKAQWENYLTGATRAFRIAASGVANTTQIHTHMCYAEFNDILPAIASLDADVITIETSRSQMELLTGFADFNYPNEIGPGVYDIHSPRVPSVEEMLNLLKKAAAVIPASHLWVNPDCGLKTRTWHETTAALRNMVTAAQTMRASL